MQPHFYETVLVRLVSEFGLILWDSGLSVVYCSFSYRQCNFVPCLVRQEDGNENAIFSISCFYFFLIVNFFLGRKILSIDDSHFAGDTYFLSLVLLAGTKRSGWS